MRKLEMYTSVVQCLCKNPTMCFKRLADLQMSVKQDTS